MTSIVLELPEEAFGTLRRSPDAFAAEIRLAAAIHWYQQQMVSQERAAMLAGMSRMEFIEELARRRIDVVDVDLEELRRDAERAS